MAQRWRNVVVPAVVAVLLGLLPALVSDRLASAQNPVGRHEVQPSGDPVPGQYIVTLRHDAVAPTAVAANTLTQKHGGRVVDVYDDALKGYVVATTPEAAEELAEDPAVQAVEQDGYVQASTTQTPAPSWGLDRLDQAALPLDNAYTYTTGAPDVHVYVIDTGINMGLPDFGGRATFGLDLVGGVNPPGSDCAGHGTHVAGTVGSATYGVAKNVQLVSVRVLNCAGSGTNSNVIAAVNWVTANAMKPAVVNMSLGGAKSAALDDAVTASVASGLTYTIAAGNKNTDACNFSPSDVADAIVVGATDQSDNRASFSNIGSCVDVFAPGVGIVSDWATAPFTRSSSGTSMAAPHVAGVAALHLERNPNASASDVATAIVANANGVVVNAGTGSPTALVNAGFVPGGRPDAPTVVAVAGTAIVNLSWNAPADGGNPITKYTIARSTTPGNETAIVPTQTQTAYADTNVTAGTTYYYTVTATNAAGTSDPSDEVSAVPGTTPPPNPNPTWTGLGGIASADPAAAPDPSDPSGAYVFVRGSDAAMYWKHASGSTWSAYNNSGGVITTRPVAIADASGASGTVGVYVFARGSDNALYVGRIMGGTWQGWQPLGGIITSTPTAAVNSSGLWVAVRGNDNSLYARRLLANSWTDWQPMGGILVGDPSLMADDTSGVLAFAAGTDNALYVRGVSPGVSWNRLGGVITTRPAPVAHAPNKSVFVRGGDGHPYWLQGNASTWGAFVNLGGIATSETAGVKSGSGLSVYVRGTDNALYRNHSNGQWGGFSPLGGVLSSNPTVIVDGNGFERVFVVGSDGGLYTISVAG